MVLRFHLSIFLLLIPTIVFAATNFTGTVTTLTPSGAQSRISASTVSLSALTFASPGGIALDAASNIYISDTSYILQISGNQAVVIAGQILNQGLQNGNALSALMTNPGGLAFLGGVLYFCDTGNNAIRSYQSSTVSAVAGNVNSASAGQGYQDGTGAAAQFSRPTCLIADTVNNVLYVCDEGNSFIRRVTPAGVVTTVVLIPAGQSMGIALNTVTNILYVGRKAQSLPSSTVYTIFQGTITASNSIPQSPPGSVLDPTGQFLIVTQDNRIGALEINTGTYREVTGTPTSVNQADGPFPSATPPVFVGLSYIIRSTSTTYYTLEAAPFPKLRQVVIQNSTINIITVLLLTTPGITDPTLLSNLTASLFADTQNFFGIPVSVSPAGSTALGNTYQIGVADYGVNGTLSTFITSLSTTNTSTGKFVQVYNTPVTALIPVNISPPLPLIGEFNGSFQTGLTTDLTTLLGTTSYTLLNTTVTASGYQIYVQLPGFLSNASTNSALQNTSWPTARGIYNTNVAPTTVQSMVFSSPIFQISPSNLTTALSAFSSDVYTLFGIPSNSFPAPGGTSLTNASGTFLSTTVPLIFSIVNANQLQSRNLSGYPALYAYLKQIPQTRVLPFDASTWPVGNATALAQIITQIQQSAQAIAPGATASLQNLTNGIAFVQLTYSTIYNDQNFNIPNITFSTSSPQTSTTVIAIISTNALATPVPGTPAPNSPPATVATTSASNNSSTLVTPSAIATPVCDTTCIVVVCVIAGLILLFLIILFIWLCGRETKKTTVIAPTVVPVFSSNDIHADLSPPVQPLNPLVPQPLNPLVPQHQPVDVVTAPEPQTKITTSNTVIVEPPPVHVGATEKEISDDKVVIKEERTRLEEEGPTTSKVRVVLNGDNEPETVFINDSTNFAIVQIPAVDTSDRNGVRVLHVTPRRDTTRATTGAPPSTLIYDSVNKRVESQDTEGSTNIRVVKVVTRESPTKVNQSSAVRSRSYVRVKSSPMRPVVVSDGIEAPPESAAAVEATLRDVF